MEKSTLLDGNAAAAWGGRLAGVRVVPNFPITPQTEMIETFAKWKADGEWDGEFLPMESEHSVLSAAIGSEATGARTFTGTSSQGLLLMHEMLYVASGMRLPIVMVNVSRGLSAPITLWADHDDILDQRDSGWLMFFCENNQEVLDSVIMAYRICEDTRVLLPALINMEGFVLSYTREPVHVPRPDKVKKFLPPYRPKVCLDIRKPMALGIGVMSEYTYFRQQLHLAHRNARTVIREVYREWARSFGRGYDFLEPYMMDGAQAAIVAMGSNATMARAAVKSLRAKGKPVGLLKIRVFRPFPEDEIRKALQDVKAVMVADNNISPGYGGITFRDIKAAVNSPDVMFSSFIMGLGGKQVSLEEYENVLLKALDSIKSRKPDVFWQDAL